MDKTKKYKRRTLVVIDGESLAHHAHYDFSFLESEKRLDIWYFFKNKIQHSFSLHKDYNAKSIVLPRYEEDTLSYIIKRVCYELGRRDEKYYKIYFIGDTHPLWEGVVQFFRERGYVAHHLWSGDYAVPSSVSGSLQGEPSEPPSDLPSEKARKPSKKPKAPISAELLPVIRAQLDSNLAGTKVSRKEFVRLLHKAGISVRKHVRYRSLKRLLQYLTEEGLIKYDADAQEVVILPHDASKS